MRLNVYFVCNVKYTSLVDKYDRHGYKQRARVILLTDLRIYGLDVQTLKLKDKINLKKIEGSNFLLFFKF